MIEIPSAFDDLESYRTARLQLSVVGEIALAREADNTYARPRDVEPEKLVEDARAVVEAAPSWSAGYAALAAVYNTIVDDAEGARAVVRDGLERAPDATMAIAGAVVYRDRGDGDAAIGLLCDERWRTEPRVLRERARTHVMVGQSVEGLSGEVWKLCSEIEEPLGIEDAYALAEAILHVLNGDPKQDYFWEIEQRLVKVLPLPEALFIRGFHLARQDELFDDGFTLFHEGLRRDPYNPVGLYGMAKLLTHVGAVRVAPSYLRDCILEHNRDILPLILHDPDLQPIREELRGMAGAYPTPSHSIVLEGLADDQVDERIRLYIREDRREEASFLWDAVPRRIPEVLVNPEHTFDALDEWMKKPYFLLGYSSDRYYFALGQLHRALRELAPCMKDARFVITDWNTSPYLDECAFVDGAFHFQRCFTGYTRVYERPFLASKLAFGRPPAVQDFLQLLYDQN